MREPVVVVVAHVAPPFSGGIAAAIEGLMGIGGAHHHLVDDRHTERVEAASIVHCHHALSWPSAERLARRLGVPAVKTVHVLQARQARMRGLSPCAPTRSERLQAEAIARADRLTIGSEAAKAMLLEDHPGLAGDRVTVLPPPSPLPRAPRTVTAAVDGPIVAVTRFDALKGTDLLVELVPRLLAAPDRSVVIAGGLPHNPRAERRWREAFAARIFPAQAERLVFSGWLAGAELAALLARARLFVTASRLETYGLALAEALRAGCPAVATDIPVHREVAGARARYAAPAVEALHAAVEAALAAPCLEDGPPGLDDDALAAGWLRLWSQKCD